MIRYPIQPPILLDLRHHGGIEIATDCLHRALLQAIATEPDPGVGEFPVPRDGPFPPDLVHRGSIIWAACATPDRSLYDRAAMAWRAWIASAHARLAEHVCSQTQAATGLPCWLDTVGARRLGFGDLLIEAATAHALARVIGGGSLAVLYDPRYPGAATIWQRVPSIRSIACDGHDPIDPEQIRAATSWPRWSTISLRGHPQATHTGEAVHDGTADREGYPGAQILHQLGWLESVPWKPVEIPLVPTPSDIAQATAALRNVGIEHEPYATIQPVERTRGNEGSTPALWQRVAAQHIPTEIPIIAGSAREDAQRLAPFIAALQPRHITAVHLPLGAWLAVVARSTRHVTGNNGGLWLALSQRTPTTIIEGEAPSIWTPKKEWFLCGNLWEFAVVDARGSSQGATRSRYRRP
ncbi:MAG: hypothetical protein WC485_03605, partial [Opitutaceae bacterium]